MAKRGPKFYQPGSGKLLPIRMIAQRLGCSERTVYSDLKRAFDKLRRHPEAYSLILCSVHTVADERNYGPCCGSVECDREFIKLNAEVR